MRGRYFVGILLILIGAGFLMDQFEIISFGDLMGTFWPSILIIAGLLGLMERHSSKFTNLLVIVIGVLFQLSTLNIIEGDIFRYIFPVILILIGLNILIPKGKNTEYNRYKKKSESEDKDETRNWSVSSEDFIDRTVLMSGLETINSSQNFKGGRLMSIMGGIDIDLRGAKMAGDYCQIEATVIMGGIDITVPRNWKIELRGTPILGGYSNKTGIVEDPSAPVLIVKGSAIMGGVEINWKT